MSLMVAAVVRSVAFQPVSALGTTLVEATARFGAPLLLLFDVNGFCC